MKTKKIKVGKLIGIYFVIAIIIGVFGAILSSSVNDEKPKNTPQIPKDVKLIMDTCDTTQEKANDILTVLTNCEILDIQDFTHDEMLDNIDNEGDTGYRITSEGLTNIILYLNKDKNVYIVRYAGVDMYSNGEYKTKLSYFYLTSSQKANLETSSKNYVKAILMSPTSADFPWFDWDISLNAFSQIATVSSYVDADNAFGTEVRTYFTLMYKIIGNNYSLIYFKFGSDIILDNRN